ncbi:MAG: DUF6044 family protein [Butyrivibrio sp.]|nr:DUF6044 family protein [Butyrivibrio sp.]
MRRLSFGKCIVFLFLLFVVLFYAAIGENSYIAIQDNLDLFQAQFAMLQNTGSFFAQYVHAPFLGGVSRDVLPSELSLYTVLFMFLPPFVAYVTGYVLKVIIAVFSMRILLLDVIYEKTESGKKYGSFSINPVFYDDHVDNFATLTGLLYGVLNLFPAFGIPFASIPLIVFLLRKAYRAGIGAKTAGAAFGKSFKWLILIFLFPFISYFSYLGFFILGYLFVAIIWLWIKDKKFSFSLLYALIFLAIGNVVFEYRLFYLMLFTDTPTIRETMVQTYLSGSDIVMEMGNIFVNGMMHVEDLHKFFIMPICGVYFIYLNVKYIIDRDFEGIFTDYFNLGVLILVFNCVVYGLYYSEPVEFVIETLLPPLTGFQYNRTIFFNPFIWCVLLFIIVYRCYQKNSDSKFRRHKSRGALNFMLFMQYVVILVAIGIVLLTPTKYNDLYRTAFLTTRQELFHHENDDLNYREFYSTELFDKIKKDLDYNGEDYCVAYGMHPAILEYNGFYTLDGYLGFYPQSYKERFREIIAPALERMEPTRLYYDDWGARCYIYSGSDLSIVMATKSMTGVTDTDIYINAESLKDLGCKYILSRIEISNAKETGIELVGTYEDESSPYTIYVYGFPEA